jgi:hypothetical protein
MGPQTKTVGGGSATGLGNQWVNFLQQGLGGAFGGPGAGAQSGIGGTLNGLFSGGAGRVGGAMASMLGTQQQQSIDALRARYSGMGGIGSTLGSGAGSAEAIYRAQAAPQITSAIGQLQLQGLNSILPQIGQMAGRGIPQAQTITQPSEFSQIMGGIAGLSPIMQLLRPTSNPNAGGGADTGNVSGYNVDPNAGGSSFGSDMSSLFNILPMLAMMGG